MQLLFWVGSVVLLLPEHCCSDLTGPKAVKGVLGSSVSVPCSYDQKYQGNVKYWCRRLHERKCPPVVSTSGSELPVIKNRVSIQDHHSLNLFTVTVYNLTSSDSGMYSCAVSRSGGLDLTTPVNVTVLDASITDNWDYGGSVQNSKTNSISYQIYFPFLVLICLKMPIFLTMVLAIIWMHRKNRQHSDEVATPETQP